MRAQVSGDVDRGIAWVCVAAGGVVLNLRRSLKRQNRLIERFARHTMTAGHTAHIETDRIEAVDVWASLPHRDRETLMLMIHGVEPDELAAGLGLSPGAAAMRVHRARRRLESALRA